MESSPSLFRDYRCEPCAFKSTGFLGEESAHWGLPFMTPLYPPLGSFPHRSLLHTFFPLRHKSVH